MYILNVSVHVTELVIPSLYSVLVYHRYVAGLIRTSTLQITCWVSKLTAGRQWREQRRDNSILIAIYFTVQGGMIRLSP